MLRPIRRSVRTAPFAKLAWGRGGVLMIVSALFSVLFTVAAYLFVCLKALAGAFGAGSVVQYVSALTALSGHLSQLVVYGGDVRSNAPFLQELFAFLDTPNEMYQARSRQRSAPTASMRSSSAMFPSATPARRIGRCAICR